jgi:hypothetical protein
VQAAVDLIMISIIAAAPDADAAQRDIANVTQVMRDRIREAHADYHAMAEAQRSTQQ